MSKISAIIPTHNRADVLPRAIRSIQMQSRPVDEIIVVSDGSTDETVVIVEELSKKDGRVKLIHYYPGKNGNYARNRGIDAAAGDYIAFLDDDDEWLPEKIEKQMAVFEGDASIGLAYTGQNCIFQDLGITYQTKPSRAGDLSKRIFIHSDPGTTSQVMLKRELLDQVGQFDENLEAMQDYDLWIRCCQVTNVGFVREPCINYYNSIGKSQVSGNTDRYISSMQYILEKYREIINSFDEEYQKHIYSSKNMSIAQRCLRNNDGEKARFYLKKSWEIMPSKKAAAMYIGSWFPYRTILRIRSAFNY